MSGRIRYVIPGLPHHAIQRGNNRQDVFLDEEDRKEYLIVENIKDFPKIKDRLEILIDPDQIDTNEVVANIH